jgi:hypothetical protein
VCGQGDLYCSANDAAAPFISSVGKILDGDAATGSKQGQLSSSMVSDWSQTNLPGLGSTVSSLENSARTLPTIADPSSTDVGTGIAGIDSGATSLVATLKPVQDLVQWVKNTPGARDVLSSASPGSPQAAAGQILNTASRIDLGGAINTAVSLANTAQQLLSPAQSGTAPSSGPNPRDALMPGTEQLAAETAPLSSLNSSTLTAGLGALQLLKPDTILDQITAVGGGIAQTAANIPQILSDFLALPQKIAAGDITGAHQVAGELNNLFSPLVKAAAGVNLGLVAQLVDMAAPFDPSGYTAIAGLIVGVLARLDIVRIANDLGQAQETLWAAVDKLAHGDVLGAGAQMTGLAPVGVDLAAAVAAMFTGGSKEDPSELAQPGTLGAQRDAFVHAVSTGDLAGMATALIQVAGAQGLSDISTVVGKGLQAADYFASNPHTDYSQGKQELQTFLEGQIRS